MNKQFRIEVLVVGLANFLVQLQGLLLLPLISQLMGLAVYGIWIQVTVAITVFSNFFGLGLHLALIRFIAGEQDVIKVSQTFWTIIGIAVISATLGSVLLVIFGSFLANLLSIPDSSSLFMVGGIAVWFGIINLQFLNFYRARRQLRTYSWFFLVNTLSDTLLVAIIVWVYHDIKLAIISMGIGRMFLAGFHGFRIKQQIRWHKPVWSLAISYLAYCIPTIPNLLCTWVLDKSDRFLIGFFAGPLAVGIYSAAYSLCSAIQLGVRILYQTLFPALAELWVQKKEEKVLELLKYALKYFQMLAIPSIFGLIFLAQPLLTLLIGSEDAIQGALLMPWISFGVFFFGLQVIYSQILYITKYTNALAIIALGTGTINVLLNIWLLPQFGVMGAAVSTFLSYFVIMGLTAVVSYRYFPIPFLYQDISKISISALIMLLPLQAIKPETWTIWNLVFAVMIGGITYAVVLLGVQVFSPHELNFLKKAISQFYNQVRKIRPSLSN